ncbi:hypothetical protein [Paradevosia shaoguanensis]|uniref:hypothetical protein n=1 Tax=Paradevosia shaoguanensis TaxID=1335043 RepID=UPI001FE6652D|nr:hypothetical protein [Paradevosia shaoguanensis]
MARTNKDRKAYICTTPQPNVLDQAAFEALTWIEIGNVGAIGESGTQTNVVSYDELATDVTQKGKGISNAGDPTIECARNPTDPGQVALRAAAKTNFNYAFKFEDKDAPDADHTNSVYYNRGLVTGPTRPNGRNEDFILEVFTMALNQREIVVDPQSIVAPTNTLLPAIAGIAQVGQVLTALSGEWTGEPSFAYRWKKAGTNIAGASGKTYVPVVGDVGADISVAVTATNSAGNLSKTSGATADVIAA